MFKHGEVSGERASKDEITLEEKENAYYYLTYGLANLKYSSSRVVNFRQASDKGYAEAQFELAMMIMMDKQSQPVAQSNAATSQGASSTNASGSTSKQASNKELTFVEQTHLSYSPFKLLKQAAKQGIEFEND